MLYIWKYVYFVWLDEFNSNRIMINFEYVFCLYKVDVKIYKNILIMISKVLIFF